MPLGKKNCSHEDNTHNDVRHFLFQDTHIKKSVYVRPKTSFVYMGNKIAKFL